MYSDTSREFEVKKVKCNWMSTTFGDPTCGTCEPSDLVLSSKIPELTPSVRDYKENAKFCNTLSVSCPIANNNQTTFMKLNQEMDNTTSIKVNDSELSVDLVCMDHKWHLDQNSALIRIDEISCDVKL